MLIVGVALDATVPTLIPPLVSSQAISVPLLVRTCPFVPKANLVVAESLLYIISPLVVIGSAKPAGTDAHFQPPVAPLSAVRTSSSVGPLLISIIASVIFAGAIVRATEPVTSPVCVWLVVLPVLATISSHLAFVSTPALLVLAEANTALSPSELTTVTVVVVLVSDKSVSTFVTLESLSPCAVSPAKPPAGIATPFLSVLESTPFHCGKKSAVLVAGPTTSPLELGSSLIHFDETVS